MPVSDTEMSDKVDQAHGVHRSLQFGKLRAGLTQMGL